MEPPIQGLNLRLHGAVAGDELPASCSGKKEGLGEADTWFWEVGRDRARSGEAIAGKEPLWWPEYWLNVWEGGRTWC